MAEDLLVRIEAGETIHRRELAALAHAALELPHALLVLEVKAPLPKRPASWNTFIPEVEPATYIAVDVEQVVGERAGTAAWSTSCAA